MRLFTIGDSFAQGFMSGGAARTDLCFSTLLARALGQRPGHDYLYPDWPLGGHPVNLEPVLRHLQRNFGIEVEGAFDWLRARVLVAEYLDRIEDHYEDGPGAAHQAYQGGIEAFHNIALRGFDIADAWQVTPDMCRHAIARPQNFDSIFGDLSPVPDHSFFRTALTVLNPSRSRAFDQHSALGWLDHHARSEGVENLLLWLGTNNVLGVILELSLTSTGSSRNRPLAMDYAERRQFSFWTIDDFAAEYQALIDRVDRAMSENTNPDWRVFIANIPPITVSPLLHGRGVAREQADPFDVLPRATYFDHYDYVFVREPDSDPRSSLDRLTVQSLDEAIAGYNQAIQSILAAANARHGANRRYWLVDIADMHLRLAYRRNNGQPSYALPAIFNHRPHKPDTRYYRAHGNQLRAGGLVSLDGVHPSALGQGLIAHKFWETMQTSGVADLGELDWPLIVASDRLWQRPLPMVDALFQYRELAEVVLRMCRMFRHGD
ncbi:MAG: hypothetical protein AAFY56_00080 [Pseudomonadota bacterium]